MRIPPRLIEEISCRGQLRNESLFVIRWVDEYGKRCCLTFKASKVSLRGWILVFCGFCCKATRLASVPAVASIT